jgi:hypothetical protein
MWQLEVNCGEKSSLFYTTFGQGDNEKRPAITWSHEFIAQGHIKKGASMSLSSTLEFMRSGSAF